MILQKILVMVVTLFTGALLAQQKPAQLSPAQAELFKRITLVGERLKEGLKRAQQQRQAPPKPAKPEVPKKFGAVMCKDRVKGEIYAEQLEECSDTQAKLACGAQQAIGDPVSPLDCRIFKTEEEHERFMSEKGKRSALTCRVNVNGILFRDRVPNCANRAAVNALCNPEDRLMELFECKDFGNDRQGLLNYLKEPIMKAQITCKLQEAGKEITVPAQNCSATAKRLACQKQYGYTGEAIRCIGPEK